MVDCLIPDHPSIEDSSSTSNFSGSCSNSESNSYVDHFNSLNGQATHKANSPSTTTFTQGFIAGLDTVINRIDEKLRITLTNSSEIPPEGYNDLGEMMGVDLLSAYHIKYIHPLGKDLNEVKMAINGQVTKNPAIPHTKDALLKLINGESDFNQSGKHLMLNLHKKESGESPEDNESTIDSILVHQSDSSDLIKLQDSPSSQSKANINKNLTNSSEDFIASSASSHGWMIVFKLNGHCYAYECDTMTHSIEVVHTESGLSVTGRSLYDADKTWPALPEWARETMLTHVINADYVNWVPLNSEDTESLPSGAVFFDFKSRGYSYGEMIDRLKILDEVNDLDQDSED